MYKFDYVRHVPTPCYRSFLFLLLYNARAGCVLIQ